MYVDLGSGDIPLVTDQLLIVATSLQHPDVQFEKFLHGVGNGTPIGPVAWDDGLHYVGFANSEMHFRLELFEVEFVKGQMHRRVKLHEWVESIEVQVVAEPEEVITGVTDEVTYAWLSQDTVIELAPPAGRREDWVVYLSAPPDLPEEFTTGLTMELYANGGRVAVAQGWFRGVAYYPWETTRNGFPLLTNSGFQRAINSGTPIFVHVTLDPAMALRDFESDEYLIGEPFVIDSKRVFVLDE